jgi:hypothetical protein
MDHIHDVIASICLSPSEHTSDEVKIGIFSVKTLRRRCLLHTYLGINKAESTGLTNPKHMAFLRCVYHSFVVLRTSFSLVLGVYAGQCF